MQRVPLGLLLHALGFALPGLHVQPRLDVQRLDERVRVEEQFEDGIQQLANRARERVVRFVQRRVLEPVGRRVRGDGGRCHCGNARAATQLLEKRRTCRSRVEDRFKSSGGKLLHLRVGQLDAGPLTDARADVTHDLLDVDVIAPAGLLARSLLGGLGCGSSFAAATVRTAPAAMEVSAAAALGA